MLLRRDRKHLSAAMMRGNERKGVTASVVQELHPSLSASLARLRLCLCFTSYLYSRTTNTYRRHIPSIQSNAGDKSATVLDGMSSLSGRYIPHHSLDVNMVDHSASSASLRPTHRSNLVDKLNHIGPWPLKRSLSDVESSSRHVLVRPRPAKRPSLAVVLQDLDEDLKMNEQALKLEETLMSPTTAKKQTSDTLGEEIVPVVPTQLALAEMKETRIPVEMRWTLAVYIALYVIAFLALYDTRILESGVSLGIRALSYLVILTWATFGLQYAMWIAGQAASFTCPQCRSEEQRGVSRRRRLVIYAVLGGVGGAPWAILGLWLSGCVLDAA